MTTITIHRLALRFDADRFTRGTAEEQALQAVDHINAVLQGDFSPLGSAQLIATKDEIEVEVFDDEDDGVPLNPNAHKS